MCVFKLRKTFVVLVLFSAMAVVHSHSSAQEKSVEGMWQGILNVSGTELELQFIVEKNQDDKLDGRMISVTQGGAEVPFSSVEFKDGDLKIGLKIASAKYEATMADDGKTFDGKFSQLGTEYDLKLTRGKLPSKLSHIETWRGEMKAGEQTFDFQLRIFEDKQGGLSGKLDSFSEGALGLKLDVTRTDDGLEFNLDLTKAQYKGTYNDAKDKLHGTWFQGGGEIELDFEKRATEETATGGTRNSTQLDRPQLPKPPFSYDVTDVRFENTDENVTLAGTLTTPKSAGPHPVVVLISGSGAQDRDETILGHKPFLVIADYLTKRGIAVLRFDERGVAESTGEFSTATSENFANDVEAAVRFCAKHKSLDKNKIGLIGHSEGGYIAPMIAARNDQIAYIVSLAGPGVSGSEILIKQTYDGAKLVGLSEPSLETLKTFVSSYVRAMLASDKKLDRETSEALIKVYTEAANSGSEIEKAMSVQMANTMKQLDGVWTRFFLKHDPQKDWVRVKCPVLAINGSKDVQVNADINLAKIKQALTKGGNKDHTIKKLDNLNHLFQNAATGAGSEYMQISETFAPEALKVIGDWLESQVK